MKKREKKPTPPRRGPPEGSKNAKKARPFDASITIRCYQTELEAWDKATGDDESRGDFIRRACNLAAYDPTGAPLEPLPYRTEHQTSHRPMKQPQHPTARAAKSAKIAELTATLAAYEAEAVTIAANLAKVKEWEQRRRDLTGSAWNDKSLIKRIRRDLELLKLPIMPKEFGHRPPRFIAGIDQKWIHLINEYNDEIEVYSRETGRRKGTRTDYDRIDTAIAIQAWENHQAQEAADLPLTPGGLPSFDSDTD
jgi:DNA-binding transcriptional regulator YiaG